jgi:tetratricopeptide (TPR) repeat protein
VGILMTCGKCGFQITESDKFCQECGSSITNECDDCGTELPTSAKFCSACGASQPPSREPILLTDENNPQYPAMDYNNRGEAYGELGQHERAIEDLDEAIRLDPQDADAY